jgi:hypothetical protein
MLLSSEQIPAPFSTDLLDLDAAPRELFRRGVLALAEGARLAGLYFRAALRLAGWRLRIGWWARWVSTRTQWTQAWAEIEASPHYRALKATAQHAKDEAFAALTGARLAIDQVVGYVRRRPRHGVVAGMVLADGLVWMVLVGLLLATVIARRAPTVSAQPDVLPASMKALPRSRVSLAPTATRLPSPTATTPPSPTPTPTLPVSTATPIPIVYSMWGPTLPGEGGWSGNATCEGTFIASKGSGGFIWPTDVHALAGRNYSWRWHPGLDLYALYGDPIYAADAGLVVYAGWNSWGYGNMVVIDHGNGWHTLYAHFSEINVSCGQAVGQGEVIGLAGSTGRSTGPHLHFEMRAEGGRVNPWGYLP